jgi:hypothetical protein
MPLRGNRIGLAESPVLLAHEGHLVNATLARAAASPSCSPALAAHHTPRLPDHPAEHGATRGPRNAEQTGDTITPDPSHPTNNQLSTALITWQVHQWIEA